MPQDVTKQVKKERVCVRERDIARRLQPDRFKMMLWRATTLMRIEIHFSTVFILLLKWERKRVIDCVCVCVIKSGERRGEREKECVCVYERKGEDFLLDQRRLKVSQLSHDCSTLKTV